VDEEVLNEISGLDSRDDSRLERAGIAAVMANGGADVVTQKSGDRRAIEGRVGLLNPPPLSEQPKRAVGRLPDYRHTDYRQRRRSRFGAPPAPGGQRRKGR
jgi:hypothetical protein